MNGDGGVGGVLIPLESINAVEVFTGGALDALLDRIRKETTTLVLDVSTPEGRKEIASVAYKIARSKTCIDDAGKTLVADWKARSAAVDAARRKARDFLDGLKDEVRRPLTEWEAEQARIEQEAIERARLEREAEERRQREELERREAEVRAREEAIEKAEREARQKEAAEQAERGRLAREERVRQEAAEAARREAAEAISQAERKAAEAQERERRAAEQAERDRIEAIRQAEERARQEAEQKDRERIAEENRVRAEQARREADIAHRKTINDEVEASLVAAGIGSTAAKKVVTFIAAGTIPHVSIKY